MTQQNLQQRTDTLLDKTEFIAIDFSRMICAMLVAAIHLAPFLSWSMEFSFWFNHTVCRLAVPLFFMMAGFFIEDRIYDGRKMRKYMTRILFIYLVFTLLHLHIILTSYLPQGIDPAIKAKLFLRDFFCVGSYIQSWYLIALFFGVFVLYLSVVKLRISDKVLLPAVGLLYVAGVLGNSYRAFLPEEVFLFMPVWEYYQMFMTTRNGLFFGLPFVTIGYLIRKYRGRIKRRSYAKAAMVFFCLMLVEAYIVYSPQEFGEKDMLFMTMPVSIMVFLAICFIRCDAEKDSKWPVLMRRLSLFLFCGHMWVSFYFGRIMSDLFLLGYAGSMAWYIIVVILTLSFGIFTEICRNMRLNLS